MGTSAASRNSAAVSVSDTWGARGVRTKRVAMIHPSPTSPKEVRRAASGHLIQESAAKRKAPRYIHMPA